MRLFFGLASVRVLGGFVAFHMLLVTGIAATCVYGFGARPVWLTVAGCVDGALLLTFLVVVPFAVWAVRDMKRFLADDAWVIWRYEPGAWQPVATERDLMRGMKWGGFATFAFVGAALLCFGQVVVGLSMIVMAVSVPLAFLLSWRYLVRDTTDGPSEVRIGPTGILRTPGGLSSFDDTYVRLARVQLDETRKRAVIRFSRDLHRGPVGVPVLQEFTTVDVPEGRLEEARQLVERFNEKLSRRRSDDFDPDQPYGPALPTTLLPD